MNHNDRREVYMEEEIDDEELQQLVLEAQREALLKEAQEKTGRKYKRPFPKWIFWLMVSVLFINTFAMIFQIYSIPAIEFLKASASLSSQEDISQYKKSVVVVLTEGGKGTGFSISSDGTILTNYHVIEGSDSVTVDFPEEGRLKANIVNTYPDVDLAVLKVDAENLPFLELAKQASVAEGDPITFIGNPLSFSGIANEGTIIDYYQLDDWDVPVMMIKAPVYRGNSGSPVFNEEGDVIGVVFATLDHDEHGKVGLFVPIVEFFNQ